MDAHERLTLLDALRGFALCGVFVSNAFMWFSGRVFIPRSQFQSVMAHAGWLDRVATLIFGTLVSGRFITLFSFLFGLGFAVQMGRAEARGASIAPVYARRLVALLAIGLTHLFLIWYGDILTAYSVLGFGLLLFRSRSDRTILVWAAGFIVLTPTIGLILNELPRALASSEVAAAIAKQENAQHEAVKAAASAAFSHAGYFGVLRANANFYRHELFPMELATALSIFGRFLLGLVAGRSRLFHEAAARLPLFRKLLFWGLGVGGVTSAALVVFQQLAMRKVINPEALPWWVGPVAFMPIRELSEVGVACVYMSGLALLFHRERGRRLLSLLAPAGRMALSNYLAHSIISVLVYYGLGLGLIGRIGPAATIGLTVSLFVVQVAWSHLWLTRFRFGPAEWLWRSLTYGKRQPMRLAPATDVRHATAA